MIRLSRKIWMRLGQNSCAINAKVSAPEGQLEHPGSINYQLSTNYKNFSINSNILPIESMNGNSSYIIDFGQEKPICSLKLKFSNGDKVVNHLNIQTNSIVRLITRLPMVKD